MTDNTILAEAVADFDDCTVKYNDPGKRNGVIADPSHMEGETLLTVYLSHLESNGFGGECLYSDDYGGGYASLFEVGPEGFAELAAVGYDLESDTVAVLYTVSSDGFCSSDELTEDERNLIIAEYEKEADRIAEEE